MKRKRFLLWIMLLLYLAACTAPKTISEGSDPVVLWADKGIEYGVRQVLHIPEGDIHESDLNPLKLVAIWPESIQFNSGEIIALPGGLKVESLEDMIHFKNLGSFRLTGSDCVDLSYLQGAVKMQQLILMYNDNLVDIGEIRHFPKLVTLSLYKNDSLTDFSPIGEVTTLKELDLNECGLDRVAFLKNLTDLRKLSLQKNSISDISPLAGATYLAELDLRENGLVSDLSVLENKTYMRTLFLDENAVSDISALGGLHELRKLRLDYNQIEDVEPIANLPGLKLLSLSSNPVTAAQVVKLRQTLPSDCEIVWKP